MAKRHRGITTKCSNTAAVNSPTVCIEPHSLLFCSKVHPPNGRKEEKLNLSGFFLSLFSLFSSPETTKFRLWHPNLLCSKKAAQKATPRDFLLPPPFVLSRKINIQFSQRERSSSIICSNIARALSLIFNTHDRQIEVFLDYLCP